MRTEAYKTGGLSGTSVEMETEQFEVPSAGQSLASWHESTEPASEHVEAGLAKDVVRGANRAQQNLHELLSEVALPAEADFYGQYLWSLNAYPTLNEVITHLSEELGKLGHTTEEWQRDEVLTNIFLLSCCITDTLDDYLLGSTYDFSKIAQVFPLVKPSVHILKTFVDITGGVRAGRLHSLRRWKEAWGAAVTEFVKQCLVADAVDRSTLLRQSDRLVRLLATRVPKAPGRCRARIPAFFRSRDFVPQDCLELGRKFVAAFPEDGRPVMVMGLRTAGSYLAPLLCAFLGRQLLDVEWIAVRPSKGLTAWEKRAVVQAAQRKTRILIVDESIHSGQTLAQAIEQLRQLGFADEDVIVLNPAEPAFPGWKDSRILQCFPGIKIIAVEPEERYKCRLLAPDTVEMHLGEYFKVRGYVEVRIVTGPGSKDLNSEWQEKPPERVDVRLKRVYTVHLKHSAGGSEVRHVLAKSVGWGWLGYHAFIAAQELKGFVPPVLGLRDGILYSEWISDAKALQSITQNRHAVIEALACYVAARACKLQLGRDPTPDLARETRHKGFEMLSNTLSRAYNSKVAAALDRPHIQRQLSVQGCPISVMTDSKMSPKEWIVAGSRLLKTDFEHHAQGKNELGMTDPAFDLAGAIFHFGLSKSESAQLVRTYVEESGDANVEGRLFLNKLLVGLWEQNLATLGLQNAKLVHRRNEFHQQYAAAWNFLVAEATQQCGGLCQSPAQILWRAPLVVTDIDGVLDRMAFGFPCATAAGIKAISLLHSHGFAVAVNTARSLPEVKQYCCSYGFAGGIAEYGAVIWDAVNQREIGLVSRQSLRQMEQVKKALQEIPGIFLDDGCQHSLRAVTYQNGRTSPLPPVLVQDVLGRVKADRLRVQQTGLDTAIVAKETDKGTGLLCLLKLFGLKADEVVAIGDSEPDLPMFRVAHSSFAPGHISCRREAKLLGCWIADLPYQPGLLQVARKISHPQGGTCDHCGSAMADWPKGKNLFLSLLSAADQTPLCSLVRKVFTSSAWTVFRK